MRDDRLHWFMDVARTLQMYDDTFSVLNYILLKARHFSNANAGTFFLVEDGDLAFAYTHNDTLFPAETAYKYAYASSKIPLNGASIARACAVTRQPLNIADVRKIPAEAAYAFNESFDNSTGYRTVSMINLPMLGRDNQVLGVMQITNHLDADGIPAPFPDDMVTGLMFLCVQAVTAIERNKLTMDMIHSMLDIVRLSDPMETVQHVERVSACAAEIYQRVAEKAHIPIDELRVMRSKIRLAAMLHDVGKVVIPHSVLKKPGRLTEEEFAIIKTHCMVGSQLLGNKQMDLTTLAGEIALHHHEKWDGTGYTGDPDLTPLVGDDIPLTARITAVADVFDALVSPRCYKPAWPWEDAVALIKRDSGTHFDPNIVETFLEVLDLVEAIYARYPDSSTPACITQPR